MAAYLVCLATIVQRVPWQGSWEGGVTRSSSRHPRCAERLGHGCPQTFKDLDLADLNAVDSRCLEVVADGLSLWHGAKLAVDTTLVSPLHSDGSARRRALQTMTVLHWTFPGAGRSARTQNSLGKMVGHGWLFWQPKWAEKLPLSSQHWPRCVLSPLHSFYRAGSKPH